MFAKSNQLKQNLINNKSQVGLWCSLANNITIEIVAGASFDWLLIDCEHSPNDLRSVLMQLQVIEGYPIEPMVRVPDNDPIVIKQYLDIGVRSFMVPMIESREQAVSLIRATRYPPYGIRGFSSAPRANRYGRIPNYHQTAADEILICAQIETTRSLASLEEICTVDGIDVVFIGPGDLSANMGLLGNPRADEVNKACLEAIKICQFVNTPIGILAPVESDAKSYLETGFKFVAVGSDVGLLARYSSELSQRMQAIVAQV